MTAPHPLTLAAAVRRAAIIAAGEARALQLTQTPRRPDDDVRDERKGPTDAS
mgnify:CR=1 FL=1